MAPAHGELGLGLPSVSKRTRASSVAQRPTALVASRTASSISSRLPLKRTVTSTVTSSPERLTTCTTMATSLFASSTGYSVPLNLTSW
jgi:hypothetical protein